MENAGSIGIGVILGLAIKTQVPLARWLKILAI